MPGGKVDYLLDDGRAGSFKSINFWELHSIRSSLSYTSSSFHGQPPDNPQPCAGKYPEYKVLGAIRGGQLELTEL